LTACNAKAGQLDRRLALELIGQGGFPDARLARDKDDLALVP
jgi:hypothetical protein